MKKLLMTALMILGVFVSVAATACPNCTCDDCKCDKPCPCAKK